MKNLYPDYERILYPDDERDVGKTILSRDGKIKGTVTKLVHRYCAGCGSVGPVYSVKWENGRRTYPCPVGVKEIGDHLQIM